MINLLDFSHGYRFMGNWHQQKVYNIEEAIDFINENLGVNNIGISVSAFDDGYPILLYIVFDFDDTTLEKPLEEAIRLYNFFIDFGYTTMINYSGSKGFHVYLKVVPKVYSPDQLEYIYRMFKRNLNLTTLDEKLFRDTRRIIRLYWTAHPKGGWCEMLDYYDGKELDIDSIVSVNREYLLKEYDNCGIYTNEFHPMPCIEKLIKDREYWIKHSHKHSFQPAQPIRMSWVALRLDEGKSTMEIVDEAESFGWDDWNPNYTSYQIEHIEGRRYIPYSCKKLKRMGYCIVKDCPYRNGTKDLMKELGVN